MPYFPEHWQSEEGIIWVFLWDLRVKKYLLSWVLWTQPPCFPLLHNPLTAFAPPHYQGCHQEGDQDGDDNERTQDAVWRVPEKSSRQRAVVEVVPVDSDEELVHHSVGPVAPHVQRHQVCAVRELSIQSAWWWQKKQNGVTYFKI